MRPLLLLLVPLLLTACAEAPPTPPAVAAAPAPRALQPGQHELSGALHNAPPGSQLELALLAVDERDRPQRTLASTRLTAEPGATPFSLRFDTPSLPDDLHIELRARASQDGRLIRRLLPLRIQPGPATLALGELSLQAAP